MICGSCHEPLQTDPTTCKWTVDGRVAHADCDLPVRFIDSPTMQAALDESFGVRAVYLRDDPPTAGQVFPRADEEWTDEEWT